ncbi:hypothetical protein QE422_002926 [Chryseobacterium sp. SORGH_AS 447]|uniref:hypothetical protein n=1 Tax=Chryseobacterium sp. SORGH_AS_0447 TaxID=3041769 RepID=UPI002786EB91|nr:hypothetical protein [Chryseobacterium sp. SORGH_AS_0447]MDQ1162558.1 hypothetical protein [Chryseobacterium sp. SORGH_AS_0447]
MMNKENIRLLIYFLLIGIQYKGQISPNQREYNKIIPVSPSTYSMFKAGEFPVDYRTGKLNVSIPLYTILAKFGVSIPIALTYNTGGIKVDETSSIAGLGWNLSIPNNISVETHGKDDLQNISASWYPSNAYDYQYNGIDIESFPLETRLKLYGLKDNTLDTEPDIYHYNLPTVSGSFVRDSNGNFHTIPYENIKISYSDTDKVFTITDDKGIVYSLGVGSNLFTSSQSGSSSFTSSLLLYKITLPNDEEITFKYQKKMSYQNISNSFTDFYYPIPSGAGDPCIMGQEDQHTTTLNKYSDNLLTEIIYNNQTVKFNYKNIINGILGRKDIYSDNPENTFALDNIQVINNKSNTIIKDFALIHDYFHSNINIVDEYKKHRLKLISINDRLENSKYSFEYNDLLNPELGSFAQDLWGYYNGQVYNSTMIPNLHYFNNNYVEGSNRSVDPNTSQAYILKKVFYPTGGFSLFSYENNTVWGKLLIPQKVESVYGLINNAYNNTQSDLNTITVSTSPTEYFYIDVNRLEGEELWAEFHNSCSNQVPNQIPENSESTGAAYLEEFINNHWEIIAVFNGADRTGKLTEDIFFTNPNVKKRIRTERKGNCFISLKISKIKYIKNNDENNIVGGLRIKSIEDFDGTSNYLKRTFSYHNPTIAGEHSSAYFASPLSFLEIVPKIIPNSGSVPVLCNMYALNADQSINSSLLGKDVVNYEFITEYTAGKGKRVYQFEKEENQLDISIISGNGFNPYQFRNKNILNEKMYNDNSTNPVREINYKYTPTFSKNILSSNSYSNVSMLIPSAKIGIYEHSTAFGSFYSTRVLNSFPIQSGKFLLEEVVTKDYLNTGTIETIINKTFSLENILKPINIISEKVVSSNSIITETNYFYAHEKGNQLMISKNMIAIPLETTTTQTVGGVTKTLDRSETVYPTSLPTTQTGNLVLPLSEKSYDKLNNAASTDVTYDKYDDKGNIVQYTEKDGTPVTVVWGYNQTQAIAIIEGITYDQLTATVSTNAIVSASNDAAADPSKEGLLLNALNDFRKLSALSGKKMTTYTYDPLIGVTSITPASGIREIFGYDAAGRLKNGNVRGKNAAGAELIKTVKQNNYHYKQ